MLGHGDARHATDAAPAAKQQQPWGIAGEPRRARGTVELRMLDTMRFAPDQLVVRAGELVFACLISGHYQGGMTGRISVRAT